MFRKIAVAYDESPEAERAFRSAIQLAKALEAELLTVTIMEELPAYTAYVAGVDPSGMCSLHQDKIQVCEKLQARAKALALHENIAVVSILIDGDTVEAIAGFVCDQKVDLLVVGLHHRSFRISRIWSTVYSLAQDVPCSILGIH